MKTIKKEYEIRVSYDEFSSVDDYECSLDNESLTVVIDGLRNYNGINENYQPPKEATAIPLYATIHSGISFQLYKACKYDSGQAGFIYLKDESVIVDDTIQLLDAIYNGNIKNVDVIEKTIEICSCCDSLNVIDYEYIDGVTCYTYEQEKQAIENFMKQYDIKKENVKDEC